MSRLFMSAVLAALIAWHPAVSAGATEAEATEAEQPQPGTLVLPEELQEAETKSDGEKQCMTVCARWGDECILINKGAGGMERKCRRTCQQFAEECF